MERVRLTKASVERVAPPQGGSVLLFDSEVKGFAVRVRYGRGRDRRVWRTYLFRYQEGYGRKDSKDRWLRIGEHGEPWHHRQTGRASVLTADAARAMATWLRGIRNGGGDPRAALRPPAPAAPSSSCPTVRAYALEVYLPKHADVRMTLRGAKETRRMLEHDVFPRMGHLPLDQVTYAVVSDWHAGMASGPVTANRVLVLLSSMLNVAKKRRLLPRGWENPCTDVKRYPEQPRDRYLSPDELVAVGRALAKAERGRPVAVAAIRVLAFTGARPKEIYTLKREQLHLDQGHVMLMRKGRPLPLYLQTSAIEVLRAQPAKPGNPYVFPGTQVGHHIHPNTIGLVWQDVRRAAGCEDVRLYDVRHTFASVAVQDGASLPIIGGLLGHSKPSTTARYAHLAESPVRKVGAKTAAKIARALKG